MHRSADEIRNTLKEFKERMFEIAREDGVISGDEQAILDSVTDGVHNLETQVMQILTEDLEDEEFDDLVAQIMEDIVHNATGIAELDGVVSEDEHSLLEYLRNFVRRGI